METLSFGAPARGVPFRLALLLVALASSACAESSTDLPTWPSPDYREIYGGGLRVSVFESPGTTPADSAGSGSWSGVGEPRIVLAIKTMSEWDCGGTLESDVRLTPGSGASTVTVEVKRVFPHGGACAGFSESTKRVETLPLGVGEHTLRVLALGQTHEFRLRVSDAAIELVRGGSMIAEAVLDRRLVVPELTTFWRFPPRSLAFYCDAASTGETCDAVARLLVSTVGLTPFQFGPDGHPPFPVPEAGSPIAVRYFLYSREEDLRAATAQLCSARERARLMMDLWSWRNETSTAMPCRG